MFGRLAAMASGDAGVGESGAIRLGPFELHKAIAGGGTGQVWLALHRPRPQGPGTPAAIKVLTSEAARDSRGVRSIHNEVRSTAALDHPHIITLYDYGLVPPSATEASDGALQAGSPYIAMEYGAGGSLRAHCGRVEWRDLRAILVATLAGLAHAHARGVVHRDIKPGNVVLTAEGVPKLTDFGIAAAIAFGEAQETVVHAATPAFTAPEQIHGSWREQGPWTDLYAFGCLAWAVATGGPPFAHLRSIPEVARAHLMEAVPALEPCCDVPEGFEGWLKRLLEKSPRRRFVRAADALWALVNLGSAAPGSARAEPRGGFHDHPTQLADAPAGAGGLVTMTVADPSITLADESVLLRVRPRAAGAEAHQSPESRPPFPRDWRLGAKPRPRLLLPGAGLGLYGLRTIPMVDRDRERDALWAALGAVERERAPRAVVLRGAAGAGKSRLARWLCERAHELGVGSVLVAGHSPIAGAADGLPAMIARELRIVGLAGDAARERIQVWLDERGEADGHEERALLALSGANEAAYRFSGATERYLLIVRFLARMAQGRPVVLWVDDAQWGRDALDFTLHLLKIRAPAALIVLTAQEEALAERPAESQRVEALAALGACEVIEVKALEEADHAALVGDLLGLRGRLAQRVAERTAGNPLFAIQLVGDWVDRGLLEPSEEGFRLVAGAEVPLPDDLHQVWSARIDEVLAGRPASDAIALEIAAILGNEVQMHEWRAACRISAFGPRASLHLAEALMARSLCRVTGLKYPQQGDTDSGTFFTGWTFVHPMLRESLERRAVEAGRYVEHHRSCASMLAERGPSPRLARHIIEGRIGEPGLAPLLEIIKHQQAMGRYREVEELHETWVELAEGVELPDDDARWAELWTLQSSLHRQLGRLDEAEAWAKRAEEAARAHGWSGALARAQYQRAALLHWRGRYREAWPFFVDAQRGAIAEGDAKTAVACLDGMGRCLFDLGEFERAIETFYAAIAEYEALEEPWFAGRIRMVIANRFILLEDWARAEEELRLSEEVARRYGARADLSDALNMRGELARFSGDLEAAEALYEEALAEQRRIGAGNAAITVMNLGLVDMARGRWASARARLQACVDEIAHEDLPRLVGSAHVEIAACCAALEDWEACDSHFFEGVGFLQATSYVAADIAEAAEMGGGLALKAGEAARARRFLLMAADYWERLGRAADAERVRAQLEG